MYRISSGSSSFPTLRLRLAPWGRPIVLDHVVDFVWCFLAMAGRGIVDLCFGGLGLFHIATFRSRPRFQ